MKKISEIRQEAEELSIEEVIYELRAEILELKGRVVELEAFVDKFSKIDFVSAKPIATCTPTADYLFGALGYDMTEMNKK